MEPLRIALYSHDSLGLGHVRRNLALAHALTNQLPGLTGRPVTGLLITGTAVAPGFRAPEGWDWVLLPGVDKGPAGYKPRNLNMRMPDLVSLRAVVLEGFLTGFRPDLIVIDRHATGIHRELDAALSRVRAEGHARIVLGLREVLDSPDTARDEWDRLGGAGVVRKFFDEIWVYGDPSIHDPVAAGEIPFSLRGLIHYTGYLATGRPPGAGPNCMPGPYFMTTVGGGSDGHALASIAAATPLPSGLGHLIVTGPQMPAGDLRQIRRLATTGTTVVAAVDDVIGHMRRAAAVVSMGGYNTVCEIMSTDVPALIVPRSQSRAEQLIRARSLSRAGYLEHHHIGTLTPQILAAWLAARLGTRVDRSRVLLNGLIRVPQLAAGLLQTGPKAAALPLPARESESAGRVAV
ncbi:glycosyltransferase family protein [Arthrobacter sp. 92]|uniref:glycosyltransferase family protein n=1 Tax=Arthrobacter sp. 92 TaxID=3418175 RepID=UPI003CFD34AC